LLEPGNLIGTCRHDADRGHDLEERARLAPDAGLEATESRKAEGDGGESQNPQVASENQQNNPEGNGLPQRKADVDTGEQDFVRDRVEILAEFGLVAKAPG